MNIPIKMNKDFEKAMAALSERYGEDNGGLGREIWRRF